jgi:hypothetical protein
VSRVVLIASIPCLADFSGVVDIEVPSSRRPSPACRMSPSASRTLYPADTPQCYAQADSPQDCVAQKEDYLECLHRTKEVGWASWG